VGSLIVIAEPTVLWQSINTWKISPRTLIPNTLNVPLPPGKIRFNECMVILIFSKEFSSTLEHRKRAVLFIIFLKSRRVKLVLRTERFILRSVQHARVWLVVAKTCFKSLINMHQIFKSIIVPWKIIHLFFFTLKLKASKCLATLKDVLFFVKI
jgi:hypothetical protein